MNTEDTEKLLNQLKSTIETLKNSLPKEMPIIFCNAIDPSRATMLRETCLYRVTELAESAYDAFLKDRLITAFILCRAFMETEALFWTFIDMLEGSLQTKNIESIRGFLDKALSGVKDKELKKFKRPNEASKVLDPHQVLTLIQKDMGKKIGCYPIHYASLSEFSHPNAAGTVDAYVTLDWTTNTAHFGQNKAKLTPALALPQLVGSLEGFTQLYDHSAALLQKFIDLCESPPATTRRKPPIPPNS